MVVLIWIIKFVLTRLTAFVVKSFAQASDFTYIDINVMTRAIRWLLDRQTQSGDFTEPGIVIQKEMQVLYTSMHIRFWYHQV